jgi:hypothetical protein
MDHTNLLYWKSPRKLNRCMARWHKELQDYSFTLEHIPGKHHTVVDALSHPPECDEGKDDNQDIQMIPKDAFICVMDEDSPGSLEKTRLRIARGTSKMYWKIQKHAQG